MGNRSNGGACVPHTPQEGEKEMQQYSIITTRHRGLFALECIKSIAQAPDWKINGKDLEQVYCIERFSRNKDSFPPISGLDL